MSARGLTWCDGNRAVHWSAEGGEVHWEESQARHALAGLVVLDRVRRSIGLQPWGTWEIYGARLQGWFGLSRLLLPTPKWWRRALTASARMAARAGYWSRERSQVHPRQRLPLVSTL